MAHNRAFILRKIKTRENINRTIGKSINFASSKSFSFYLKRIRGNKKKHMAKKSDMFYKAVLNCYTKLIAEKMIENPDGVYIEGLGYFGMLLIKTGGTNVKVFNRELREVHEEFELLPHSDGMTFSPHFVPIEKTQMFRTWVMDCSFYGPLKRRMVSKLLKGFKYNFQAPLFYQFTGQRKRKK